MHESNRTSVRGRVTVTELVIVVIVLALLTGMLLPEWARWREEHRPRCPNNLSALGKGIAMYLSEYGDNRWFPCPLGRGQTANDYNGAEWLASLYWTGIVTDPDVFVCPTSKDSNDDGRQLGRDRAIPGLFGSQTVSYAGLHYKSLLDEQGGFAPAIEPTDYPPNKIMASDDTQGDINHGSVANGGMAILFFDSHVEFRTSFEMDIAISVGSTAGDGLLRDLRN